jgi:hypothetical protein
MIYNLSHNDRAIQAEVDTKLGKAFGLVERFRMGGNGSPALLIAGADEEIDALLPHDGSLRKCNIELRPNGLILGFKKRLETYGWVIPYYQLNIFKSGDQLNLYAGKHQVSLVWKGNVKNRDQFLLKLMQLKASFSSSPLPD